MNARAIAGLLALGLSAVTFAGSPPAVVLVSLDTFRADRLAPFGGPADLAPALDALAARSAAFSACFTPAPVTLAAHASLLTGCYPSRTGLHDNGPGVLSPSVPTLAEVFAARGYRTEAVVASAVLGSRHGLSRGFLRYDDGVGPSARRTATQVTDLALAALKRAAGRPVFLWAHYFDAHEPYPVPPAFAALRPGDPYDAAAAYVDTEVGRLLKALPAGSLVAVVSDHGEALGEHGELTHGVLLFQPTVRVACLFSGPGVTPGLSAVPCSLADVAPTLVRLAFGSGQGLPCDGTELTTLARASAAPRSIPLETWLPFDDFRWSPLVGATDGRWKWVRGPSDRLYDLKADPAETRDLAASPPPEAERLRAALPLLRDLRAPAGEADPSPRGLGYLGSTGGPARASLPDPHQRTGILKLMAQARQARALGDGTRSADLYRQAAEGDPGDPTAWFEYGETLRRNGALAEAGRALDRAIAIAPDLGEAWTAKGHLLVSEDKAAQAAACYERALALQPDAAGALDPLAAYYLDLNQPERAFPLLQRAIAGGFADSATYLIQGRVHLVQDRDAEAAKDFEAALNLSEDPARTLKETADIYMVKKRYAQGLALYGEGIRRYPDFAPNYLTLGSYYLTADQPGKALPLFKRALGCDLGPQDREQVQQMVRELEEGPPAGSPAPGP